MSLTINWHLQGTTDEERLVHIFSVLQLLTFYLLSCLFAWAVSMTLVGDILEQWGR